jgi:hypothetical protein
VHVLTQINWVFIVSKILAARLTGVKRSTPHSPRRNFQASPHAPWADKEKVVEFIQCGGFFPRGSLNCA